MTLRLTTCGLALAAMLFLSGCGDTSVNDTSSDSEAGPYQAASVPTLPPVTPTPTSDADPLATPDPLASDGNDLGSSDPLNATPAHDAIDPILGRTMPTDHSHWLNVEMYDARVTVRLNGIQIGTPSSFGTTDITMRLHKGPNSLALTYAPRSARSWSSVNIVEGEHDPPRAPLVSFRQAPQAERLSTASDSSPAPVIKTFTFMAE